MLCLYRCVCTTFVPDALRGQKKASGPLELVLECLWGTLWGWEPNLGGQAVWLWSEFLSSLTKLNPSPCLVTVYISSLKKWLTSLGPFLNWVGCLLLLSCKGFFFFNVYILFCFVMMKLNPGPYTVGKLSPLTYTTDLYMCVLNTRPCQIYIVWFWVTHLFSLVVGTSWIMSKNLLSNLLWKFSYSFFMTLLLHLGI